MTYELNLLHRDLTTGKETIIPMPVSIAEIAEICNVSVPAIIYQKKKGKIDTFTSGKVSLVLLTEKTLNFSFRDETGKTDTCIGVLLYNAGFDNVLPLLSLENQELAKKSMKTSNHFFNF